MCMLAFVSVIVCCNESDRRIGILSKRKNRTEKNHTNHFRSAQMYLFIRFYSIFRPGHRRAASDRVTRDLISKRHEKKTSQTPHLSFLSPSLHLKWLRILIRHFWDEHFIFRWNFEKWINEFMDKKRANIKNSPIQFSVHRESARSRIQNHQVNGIFVFLFIALAELVFGFPRAHASRSTRRNCEYNRTSSLSIPGISILLDFHYVTAPAVMCVSGSSEATTTAPKENFTKFENIFSPRRWCWRASDTFRR